MNLTRLSDINFARLCDRSYHPSPVAWEDQVLYFLMLDRFSDDKETGYRDNQGQLVFSGSTPQFQPSDSGNANRSQAEAIKAGSVWCGGTLKGLCSKVGYLKRLGVTAIWISPLFKQVSFQQTYHGYGIQNFLEVDPNFGTKEDLRDLVETAHANGIYVILDVVLNHSGNVFTYADADRYRDEWGNPDPRWDGRPYNPRGFNDKNGLPLLPFQPLDDPLANPDLLGGGVWPTELQQSGTFTAMGRISNWDYPPEYTGGDFFDLKDIRHGEGDLDNYRPSEALRNLCEVYKYWIAYADIDGFRVDTVKHMEPGATRFFTSVIHEFTESIGKNNFYLIGEITGGRSLAFQILEQTGMDAALGVSDIPGKLRDTVLGRGDPYDYFQLFRNSLLVNKESHTWFKNKVVTFFDDHDQVGRDPKTRFSAEEGGASMLLCALALNVTTIGIPCIYYGSEQGFNGSGPSDCFLREAIFGGEFGSYGSRQRHFFNENHPVFRELAKILQMRRQYITLRRGRQYFREISGPDDGVNFGLPRPVNGQLRWIIPWSRIFNDQEMVLAINTDPDQSHSTWVTIDNSLHRNGERLQCLYSTDPAQVGRSVTVESRNGKAVMLEVPAAGFVIYL